MTFEELKIYLAIFGSLFSILVALHSLNKSRRDKIKAIEQAAVKEAAQETRVTNLETSVSTLKTEIHTVKSGLEGGIGKVQDSLQGVVDGVNALQTKVAILIDRDEREERVNLAAQTAAQQFAATRPASTRSPKPRP